MDGDRNICRVCKGQIVIMTRRGEGICCELCEKAENNEDR